MASLPPRRSLVARPLLARFVLAAGVLAAAACAHMPGAGASAAGGPPSPDPRVGLKPGMFDAGQAAWNMKLLSNSKPQGAFLGATNSDLAFTGHYAIQGSYNGYQVWDISNPSAPTLKTGFVCPASQSDVSVYKNLLFVSGEGLTGRRDCGREGVH